MSSLTFAAAFAQCISSTNGDEKSTSATSIDGSIMTESSRLHFFHSVATKYLKDTHLAKMYAFMRIGRVLILREMPFGYHGVAVHSATMLTSDILASKRSLETQLNLGKETRRAAKLPDWLIKPKN